MTGTTVLLSADAESYWAKDEQARMAERLSALGLALMTSGLEPVPDLPKRAKASGALSATPKRALRKKTAAPLVLWGKRPHGSDTVTGTGPGAKASRRRTGAARKSGGNKTP